MGGQILNFSEQQEAYEQHCIAVAQEQFSALYEVLKKRGIPPDYIFKGAWECLIEDITADMSENGIAYVAGLMGIDMEDYF